MTSSLLFIINLSIRFLFLHTTMTLFSHRLFSVSVFFIDRMNWQEELGIFKATWTHSVIKWNKNDIKPQLHIVFVNCSLSLVLNSHSYSMEKTVCQDTLPNIQLKCYFWYKCTEPCSSAIKTCGINVCRQSPYLNIK